MDATATLANAEKFLHAKIPITRAMGVRVVAHDDTGFTVEAPVALNANHLRTAFGGSINAVATLAAYGFLWVELNDAAAHVVVAESKIRFLRPIRATIRARCLRPPANDQQIFRAEFAAKGKARITLRVEVSEGDGPAGADKSEVGGDNGDGARAAAEFEGIFVARAR